jgi:hypothetical protein
MLTSPERSAPVFGATVNTTAADALPLCPELMTIHDARLAALHAQPDSVRTSTDKRPPAAPIESLPRLTVYRHGAAACDT